MAKIVLPFLSFERILIHVRGILADLKREPSDTESRMVEWLEMKVSHGLTDSINRVASEVGKLRPGWNKPMTSVEMHDLHGALDTLQDLVPSEWQTIREFLAYKPKTGEKLFQVTNRLWFIQNPVNTLNAAEIWKRDREKRRPSKTGEQYASTHQDTLAEPDVKALLADVFKDFHTKADSNIDPNN